MDFDIWGFLKAEALAPGIVFGSYDHTCRACEKTYVVHVENNHHTLTYMPILQYAERDVVLGIANPC
jgi:hypothetical protein